MAIKTKLQLAEKAADILAEYKADIIKFGIFNERMAMAVEEYNAYTIKGSILKFKIGESVVVKNDCVVIRARGQVGIVAGVRVPTFDVKENPDKHIYDVWVPEQKQEYGLFPTTLDRIH